MSSNGEEYRDVWVYLEREDDVLSKDSTELLAAGRKIADKLRQQLVGVILGSGLGGIPRAAIECGADRVLAIDDPTLGDYFSLRIIDELADLVTSRKPYSFLFLSTEQGKDLAPRLAYRVRTGLATDTIDLEVADYFLPQSKQAFKNLVIQIRPDFGTRVAKIYTPRTRPQMSTVRPGNFKPLEPDPFRTGTIEQLALPKRDRAYSAVVKEIRELPRSRVNLKDAKVVIGLGLGVLKDGAGRVRDPREAFDLAQGLKHVIETKYGLKTEIGASRALIYAELKPLEGLIGKENQVGQTGSTISPQLYIALGISGALQHQVGMWRSRKILAVNLDPSAPIFKIAHYPVVGDLYEFVPDLTRRLDGGGGRAG